MKIIITENKAGNKYTYTIQKVEHGIFYQWLDDLKHEEMLVVRKNIERRHPGIQIIEETAHDKKTFLRGFQTPL